MENREALQSILPFLPLELESGILIWPALATETLKSLSKGPNHSRVDSGEALFIAISDLRSSLSPSDPCLSPSVGKGYALFFDQLMSREESTRWFGEVIPVMANLLLRLPALLASHYQGASGFLGVETGLRLLKGQQAGIVVLSQELIAALLCCSFLCLFPAAERYLNYLPHVNFHKLFWCLHQRCRENLEHKIKCITHYFERVCACMPSGFVSYERKVLPLENSGNTTYPDADFWGRSLHPLCPFEVYKSGLIEDHFEGALEVDFANKYLGGGALRRGCVQEEIRFMINPELVAGMLFLPLLSDNEAIEIVGAERFSNYTGYASTFRLTGDYVDKSGVDQAGRRKTRITAIDALRHPGERQYEIDCLLREVNKAFCGFSDQLKYLHYKTSVNDRSRDAHLHQITKRLSGLRQDHGTSDEGSMIRRESQNQETSSSREHINKLLDCYGDAGVATGNWGCGAFGGDPEVKAVIQWIAASQASRSFISYYTFGLAALENLDQATKRIISEKWRVGELWNMLLEYSSKRVKRETELGFISWLVPSSDQEARYNCIR